MPAPHSLSHVSLSGLMALALISAACSGDSTGSTTRPTPMTPESAAPVLPPPVPEIPSRARSRVVFDAVWSQATQPQDFPDDAHFSGLIGGTHNAAVTFWSAGALASEGIRTMAERGGKRPLQDEVEAAIGRGTAEAVLSGGAVDRSPGAVVLDFEIGRAHPLVTLVTMVAPSPDWFVGVSGVALLESNGWLENTRVDLFAYDAGTDSGTTFRSPDAETRPRQPIARLTGFPFVTSGRVDPIGTFTFTRLP